MMQGYPDATCARGSDPSAWIRPTDQDTAVRIYLDHNATTPVDPLVADAVARTLRDVFGNPSSIHFFGQQAKAILDEARAQVAALVAGQPSEIVFTSGGTEADNVAIRGVADAARARNRMHLVTSAIEHEAVLRTLDALGRNGWTVSLVPVDATGLVSPARLEEQMRPDTALVSVMHANNEIGTVQPIPELARVAHAHGAVFHTDAVQSVGKIPVDVKQLGVDLLSLSAHKFSGPKGAGALWVKRGTRMAPVATGGRQERNRRPGTENVPGLVGLGAAATVARRSLPAEGPRQAALRDRLEQGILASVPGTEVNGARGSRVPNTTNISFQHVEAESLLIALDLEGIAVSTGSACSSGTLEPSHVLHAMGLPSHRAQSSIRFSLGTGTTEQEIDRVLEVLPRTVEKLRRLRS
jgi:cysteine desulfurase